LGVQLAFVGAIQRFKAPGLAMFRIDSRVIRLRCARELEDFLDDAVHVKHERHTAIADECEPQFLFFHEQIPRGDLASILSSVEPRTHAVGNRIYNRPPSRAAASRGAARTRRGSGVHHAYALSVHLTATD